ncbi:MAG TPA: hypothetical protein VF725_00200 [Ktedonobacterales bacterium]
MLQHLGWGAPHLTWRQRHPRLTRALACILLLFLFFEIGIRFIPPNGMTYTRVDLSGKLAKTFRSTDPQTVDSWHARLTGFNWIWTPEVINNSFVHCGSILGYQPGTSDYTFTYDGIPVESFTGDDQATCGTMLESAGGIPNLLWEYADYTPIWEPLPLP